MDEAEFEKMIAALCAAYPNTPTESARFWMLALQDESVRDVARAIDLMSRKVRNPSRTDLVEYLHMVRTDREARETAARPRLSAYAQRRADQDEQQERSVVAADVCRELLEDMQDGRLTEEQLEDEFDLRMRIPAELRPARRAELKPRPRVTLPRYTGPGCYDQLRREIGETEFRRARHATGGSMQSIGDIMAGMRRSRNGA